MHACKRNMSFKKGSKRHLRSLKKCVTSPSSKLCRKHVYHSKGIKIKTRSGSFVVPKSGSMTRSKLRKNRHGRYVSKKKSIQGMQQYQRKGSKLRQWNKAVREMMGTGGYDNSSSYVPYDDDAPPYVPFEPRRSNRPPKPLRPGDLRYHGVKGKPNHNNQ